jgi:hypothetical protein
MKISALIWYLLYGLTVLAMFATWWLGRVRPDRIPRVKDVIEQIMIKRTTRIAVITVWWWLGWHFFSD